MCVYIFNYLINTPNIYKVNINNIYINEEE